MQTGRVRLAACSLCPTPARARAPATSRTAVFDSSVPRPATKPATTTGDAVQQARAALRRFREDCAEGTVPRAEGEGPICGRIQLPLPTRDDDAVRRLDESDWPGGVEQKFRTMRPLIDDLLEGYNAEFLGQLEDPADGIGVWSVGNMTVVCNVSDATFQPFARLCAGDFGKKPTQADHILVAINCSWSLGSEIGQFWQKDLKRQATEIISERIWHDVYHLWVLRSNRGAMGWLSHTWGEPWRLYDSPDADEGRGRGDLLKTFSNPLAKNLQNLRPDPEEVLALMVAARDAKPADKKGFKLW